MNRTYNTYSLTLEDKKNILTMAKKTSYKIWVDELDCRKSFARQPSEITPDEMIQVHLTPSCHFVIIERNPSFVFDGPVQYVEFGFCTMDREVDLYLFIYVEVDKAEALLKSYNLPSL